MSELDLLEISIRKGGTSVLAHGYLVNQTITECDAEFFFGYGVFLQLLDDLQDVVGDKQRRHATVFTKVSGRQEPLDRLTSRVYHFMQSVLENATRFSPPKSDLMRELISKNCGLLMLQAIAQHQRMFSRNYLSQLEPYSPLPFSYLCQSPERMQQVFQKAKRGYARRHHDAAIYDVLG